MCQSVQKGHQEGPIGLKGAAGGSKTAQNELLRHFHQARQLKIKFVVMNIGWIRVGLLEFKSIFTQNLVLKGILDLGNFY